MTKKKSKGGPFPLGDFWGDASLAGDEDPKDPWRVDKNPWRGKRRR